MHRAREWADDSAGGPVPGDAVVEDPLALRYCIDKVGADNVMWAIDYPYQPTAPAVAFIESAPMSEAHREKIACKNAERIFRITAGG